MGTISSSRPTSVRRLSDTVSFPVEIVCGVYLVTCYVTGTMYVGSSVDIRRRWRQHRSLLRGGRSSCTTLQAEWDRHPEQFSFAILRECNEDSLHRIEQEYIDWLKPCLNSDPQAGSSIGRCMTAAQRERLKLRPQSIGDRYEIDGEALTIPEIALRFKIGLPTLYARLRNGARGAALVEPPQDMTAKTYEFEGRQVTRKELAGLTGLSPMTIYTRLRAGKTGDELVAPRAHRGRHSRDKGT